MQGRAMLKRKLAVAFPLDAEFLPYHTEVLNFVKESRAQGRTVTLASASDEHLVGKVAEFIGAHEVIASNGAEQKWDTRRVRARACHPGPYRRLRTWRPIFESGCKQR
jgi:phosphoserine phosphatase